MPGEFGLVVTFTLHEGAGESFDRLVRETVTQIRERESGTLVYACHQVEGWPAQRVFYELYRDRAAFDEHEAQPHTKRFLAERECYLTGLSVSFLTPYAAAGLGAGDIRVPERS